MSQSIDGFVIPMPAANLAAYIKLSRQAGKVWREYGALNYFEYVGDDLDVPHGKPFGKLARTKEGESVVFSYISYKSRKHRDQVNAKVMKDPRILAMCADSSALFDPKRMSYGGFKSIVNV